jgi:hypothetical protein
LVATLIKRWAGLWGWFGLALLTAGICRTRLRGRPVLGRRLDLRAVLWCWSGAGPGRLSAWLAGRAISIWRARAWLTRVGASARLVGIGAGAGLTGWRASAGLGWLGGWRRTIAWFAGLDGLRCWRAIAGLIRWRTISGIIGGWPIAWVSRIVRGRAVDRSLRRVGWTVVWWVIVPVAAVSGITGVVGWARVIPDGRWTIAADPDSAPWAAVVVDAVTPSPTPSAPSPGLVVGDEESDADAYSEGDERGCYDGAGAGCDVDDGGVVLRDIDDLWLGGLNDVDGLIGDLLDFNLLLLVGAEGSGGVGLAAQALDGCGDFCLVGRHGLADGGVIVDVVGHHLKHGREGY